MNLDLTGRRALVCGASQGIGREVATALASMGAHVFALARREAPLQSLVDAIRGSGGTAEVVVADLDSLDPQSLPGDLDIVIHNTGGPPGGPLVEAETTAIQAALNRHVLSAHTIMQHALPGMRAKGYGRFVNVLSTSVREPIPNLGVSNLTRAAMASWAKTLSRELPPGVTINNILPGFTDTERLSSLAEGRAKQSGTTADKVRETWIGMVPEGRLGRPDEIANVIAFLVTPQASYLRGQSIAVDGGRLRSI